MRVPFLVLTPASLFLGFSTSIQELGNVNYFNFLLVVLCAFLAHISVNMLNEYYDFQSGLDAKTIRTPFSGGSGALIENPSAVDWVLRVGIASLIITTLIGIYFTLNLGVTVIPLGIAGILLVATYTPWLNRSPFLCLVAPGIGFGPLMVVGTHLVFTGEYSLQTFWISLVPFFLVSNLLLLNQFPDIEADRSTGRRHFPIAYGVKKSTQLYGAFVLAACATLILSVFLGVVPMLSLIGLLPLALATVVFFGANKYATSIDKLTPYMGMNVVATILTPILIGIGIIYG